jgi:hypothetical protein
LLPEPSVRFRSAADNMATDIRCFVSEILLRS